MSATNRPLAASSTSPKAAALSSSKPVILSTMNPSSKSFLHYGSGMEFFTAMQNHNYKDQTSAPLRLHKQRSALMHDGLDL